MQENKIKLPVDYDKLTQLERKAVREQYIDEQEGLCMYCKESLFKPPPSRITDLVIN